MPNLSELRISLAAARVTLRQAKDELETAKAIAETNMIANGAAGGKNAEERARALTVALEGSTLYRGALSYLRESEAYIDQIQATIAIEEDTIRIEELRVREKLAEALLGRRESAAADDAATDYQAERYSSGFGATLRRQQHTNHEESVFPAGSNAGEYYPNDWYKTE